MVSGSGAADPTGDPGGKIGESAVMFPASTAGCLGRFVRRRGTRSGEDDLPSAARTAGFTLPGSHPMHVPVVAFCVFQHSTPLLACFTPVEPSSGSSCAQFTTTQDRTLWACCSVASGSGWAAVRRQEDVEVADSGGVVVDVPPPAADCGVAHLNPLGAMNIGSGHGFLWAAPPWGCHRDSMLITFLPSIPQREVPVVRVNDVDVLRVAGGLE